MDSKTHHDQATLLVMREKCGRLQYGGRIVVRLKRIIVLKQCRDCCAYDVQWHWNWKICCSSGITWIKLIFPKNVYLSEFDCALSNLDWTDICAGRIFHTWDADNLICSLISDETFGQRSDANKDYQFGEKTLFCDILANREKKIFLLTTLAGFQTTTSLMYKVNQRHYLQFIVIFKYSGRHSLNKWIKKFGTFLGFLSW